MRPTPPTTITTTTPGEEILSHGRAHQSKMVQGVVVDLRMCWPQEPTNLGAIPFLFQKLPEIHKVVLDSPRPLNKTTHPLIFLRGSSHQRSESVKTQHHLMSRAQRVPNTCPLPDIFSIPYLVQLWKSLGIEHPEISHIPDKMLIKFQPQNLWSQNFDQTSASK